MLDCRNLPELSADRSGERIRKAEQLLGTRVVSRILAFALYLLGASRNAMAEFAEMPSETAKSLTTRVFRDGLPAFEDRRRGHATFLPQPAGKPVKASLEVRGDFLRVCFAEGTELEIPRSNRVQCRTVLLTLVNGGLLTPEEAAEGLGISEQRVRLLRRKLVEQDAPALIDQRRGTQGETRVTPEVRAELIQQFVFNVVTNARTSSPQLSKDLENRCQIVLPARTIRFHVQSLGLQDMGRSLREMLRGVKKTSVES